MFGASDAYLQLLLEELGSTEPLPTEPLRWPDASGVVLVPYDAQGNLLPGRGKAEGERCMWLDLRPGAKVKLHAGNNIQQARQPQFMHICAKPGASFKGKKLKPSKPVGVVVDRNDTASQCVAPLTCCWVCIRPSGPAEAQCVPFQAPRRISPTGTCYRLPAPPCRLGYGGWIAQFEARSQPCRYPLRCNSPEWVGLRSSHRSVRSRNV